MRRGNSGGTRRRCQVVVQPQSPVRAEASAAQQSPGARAARSIAAVAIIGTAAVCALLLARALLRGAPAAPSQASQFWVTYGDGFVRRGLLGEVLTVLAGGPPTAPMVYTAAVVLALAAIAGLTVIVAAVTGAAPTSRSRLLILAILVASPLTYSLLVKDLGRYDAVGVAVLGCLVALVHRVRGTGLAGRCASTALVACLVAAATASEEFLLAFIAPACVIAMRLIWGKRATLAAAVALAPAVVIALASLAHRPSAAFLVDAVDAAHRAGIAVDATSGNAITALSQTSAQALSHVLGLSPVTLPLAIALFGGAAVVALYLVWRLLGCPRIPELWLAGAVCAATAIAVGLVGIDYRRWWALAFIGTLSALALLASERTQAAGRTSAVPRWAAVVVGVVVAVSLAGQLLPVEPFWDSNAPTRITLTR